MSGSHTLDQRQVATDLTHALVIPERRARISGQKRGIAGKHGAAVKSAIEHQIMVGDFFGAEDFVPVTQAHIMADTESLGEHNVRWLERLAAETKGDRTVRIARAEDLALLLAVSEDDQSARDREMRR